MSGTSRTAEGHGRLGSMLSGVAVALGCLLFLGGFVWAALLYRPYTVPTPSMSPTIGSGDRVLAQRIAGDDVRRGDVVVFTDKAWGDLPLVKRVVGVGGDKVACCTQGKLTVNGREIAEPYLPTSAADQGTSIQTTVVPKGRLFLLGDERAGSLDSTAHIQDAARGSVPRDAVDARVDAIAWPLKGMLSRPTGFEVLPGGISQPGPLRLMVSAVVIGVILVFGGAAHGPLVRRRHRRRSGETHPGKTAARAGRA
ncbi:signal peptidase I [Streptomyces tsukubensis]|uniref:Signal peptidase I n=1 Tax=Streptomyces tsukubensis TaxID=83656 RepID=A0A1V4A647_9ACTN|nr:signal peptidase I [Streptomyces tsukubensis]OON76402.1 signal peptidase I [Streptomyces tsukubensis]QFR95981.1 signal peptidase I [Streptomyces tsukubensis]